MGASERAFVLAISAGSVLAYALVLAHRRRRSCRPSGRALASGGISCRFANAVTAVRGKLTQKANEYKQLIAKGQGGHLPFAKVVECNIGNPQALGQKPLTFVRQVLALMDYPELLDRPEAAALFPADVLVRARTLLENLPGGLGAYSESAGALYVREAAARFITERDGHPTSCSEIFLTDGASEAVKIALQLAIRDENDAILVPIPQYPLYSGSINLFGGSLVGYYLDEQQNWALSAKEVQRALEAARKAGKCVRALVVINPGNPTGNTLSLEDQVEIARLCAREHIVLLADEVYQANLYCQEKPFISFKKVVCDLGEEVTELELFSFHSVSKGFLGECGRRGGYVECHNIPAEAKGAMYKLIALGLCANVTGQVTMELMLNPPKPGDASFATFAAERDRLLASLQRRSQLCCDAFNCMEGISCSRAEGALYLFPNIRLPASALVAAAKLSVAADAFYAEKLLDNTGICIVPGSGFQQRPGTHHLRFAFLPAEADIAHVLGLMKAFHARFMLEFQ
ncbi:alanine aminotransferase 2 [Pavlovales sp. CCMP2436]|nr:alanine aminotransferase 2 [Pavlovales sp. CCMP2436]